MYILCEGLGPREPMAEFVNREKKALNHLPTTAFTLARLLFFFKTKIVVAEITGLLSVIKLEQFIRLLLLSMFVLFVMFGLLIFYSMMLQWAVRFFFCQFRPYVGVTGSCQVSCRLGAS